MWRSWKLQRVYTIYKLTLTYVVRNEVCRVALGSVAHGGIVVSVASKHHH